MRYGALIYDELYQKFVHNNIHPHTLQKMRRIYPPPSKGQDPHNHDRCKVYSRHTMNVLLTGATGYIGGRLMNRLLAMPDVQLRVLARNPRKLLGRTAGAEVARGDTLEPESLTAALDGIDTAYYLVHSMAAGAGFDELDRRSAENFRDACIVSGVKRIIYLGGLGTEETGSHHLKSRIETGRILSAFPEKIQALHFRAGVIIGSGGASYEIIRHLVAKLPVMITPRWVSTITQPIAVDDVLAYLSAAKDLGGSGNHIIDIGAERMSYGDMMSRAARVMGLRRLMVPVPFFSPRLSSYWLALFTPVPVRIASALVEGLSSETIVLNDNAALLFPAIRPMPFEDAVRRALDEEERRQVSSRWCDGATEASCDTGDAGSPPGTVLRMTASAFIDPGKKKEVFDVIESIGGESGWYGFNFLWRVRGLVDKFAGGYGLSRGRRHPDRLRVGDGLDFWKVEDIVRGKRLLLRSQMKLPGSGWLEFTLPADRLDITAHLSPRGLGGHLYWYLMYPAHYIIFRRLARAVVRRSR